MRWFRRGEPGAAAPVETMEPAPPEEDAPIDYVTDAPIEDAQHDRFGRRIWACRIADTISAQRDPASLVVGIYGPWGDGKTSVLNLIHDTLGKAPGMVPVRPRSVSSVMILLGWG